MGLGEEWAEFAAVVVGVEKVELVELVELVFAVWFVALKSGSTWKTLCVAAQKENMARTTNTSEM